MNARTKFLHRYVRPYLTETSRKGYTMLGLSLISVIGFGYLAILPSVSSIVKVISSLKIGEGYSEKFTKKIDDIKKAKGLLTSHQQSLQVLDRTVLPDEEDYGGLVEELAKLASRSLVKLDFYQKISEPDEKTRNSFDCWLGVSGGYEDVVTFLRSIDGSSRLLTIGSVTLNSNSESELTATTQIRATISIKVHKYINQLDQMSLSGID